jgi:hypothetical protein
MSYSDDEIDFQEGMEHWDHNNDFEPNYEEENQEQLLQPQNLHSQIRQQGDIYSHFARQNEQLRNMMSQQRDIERYGRQNNDRYSMENFIVDVLDLDMNDENVRRMVEWGEATDYIINKALEVINSGNKKEIHFTPQDDTEYKKIKVIYDKLASDLQKMICGHLKLSPCPSYPRETDNVISTALQRYPKIESAISRDMTIGYKLKVIEDYLEDKIKTDTKGKGGRKTKRRQAISKRLTTRKTSRKYNKSKRQRRTRSKKM